MRISQHTDQERQTFEQEITLKSGVKFDHRDTLAKINKHKRGQFHNCDDPNAIFWPLGQERAPHFAKKLDVDTRHFAVEGYGDYNYYQAWVTNIRFRKWSRDTGFPQDLDDLGDASADFGSTALKLVEREKGGYDVEECDLMNLWFDTTIKEFYDNTKIELHELEKHQVLKKDKWNNPGLAWDKALVADYIETEKSDTTVVVAEKRKFWERVGYFNVGHYEGGDLENGKYLPEYMEDNEGKPVQDKKTGEFIRNKDFVDNWKFMHTIHSGLGDGEVVVFAEELKPEDDIYVDLHISKYEDRWLRIGVYERLFGIQKMTNEAVNYDREAQQIASLILFKTKNKKLVGSSILQQAKSGLITDAELEQIGITNTFLNDFVVKLQAYEAKADKLCLTPDVLTGAGSDAKTFRGQAALTNMANSAFKKSRDRICFTISDILVRRILPEEIKEWNKEKSLEVAGFDIDVRMFDALAPLVKLEEYISKAFAAGKNPTIEDQRAFVERVQRDIEREGRKFTLPENFFDFDFGLSINASGETENKEQMNDAYFNVISWILANPAANLIPAFREYCEKNGITPFHLSAEQQQQISEGMIKAPAEPAGRRDKLSASIDTEQ